MPPEGGCINLLRLIYCLSRGRGIASPIVTTMSAIINNLNIVISGTSHGLGFEQLALAAGFLRYGDRVVSCGRNQTALISALEGLREQATIPENFKA